MSETHGSPPVVIAAGTPITCEFRDTICVAAVDCCADQPVAVGMFTRWQGSAPRVGDAFPRCRVCEGSAFREGRGGVELHTPEIWQSLRDGAKLSLATKADVDAAVARLDAKIEATAVHFERVLWKHTLGIILNVLVIGGLLIWLFH